MTVHATSPEQIERARATLATREAHAIRHYGEYEITELD